MPIIIIVPPNSCSFFLSFQVTDMTHENQLCKFFQMLSETITKHLLNNDKGGTTLRILEFNVNKQRLNKKLDCNFEGLVAGSVGYLHAKFYFSENDWNNCVTKVARFWLNDREYAEILDANDCCNIPPEALTGKKFEVSIIGAAPGYKIETNRIVVRQEVY